MKKPDDSSLTPQRKHRKLLKDGSGSEVWPESVEKIFVAGLRQYWDSPWATHSRGRSRWRNQFLVDYLLKAGVERSKKQVASHIQVLRNMWKGEPEFHLVAGGEELFLEVGLITPVKTEDTCDTSALIELDSEDTDDISPSTAGFSPADYNFKNLPSSPPSPHLGSYPPRISTFSNGSPHSRSPSPVRAPLHPLAPCTPVSTHHDVRCKPLPVIFNTEHMAYSHALSEPQVVKADTPRRLFYNDVPPVLSRISGLCLWAEGMSPSNIQVDSLTYGDYPPLRPHSPITLHIKLCLSPIDDIRSPPALHGFQGTVSFAASWSSSAKCVTKVFAGNTCISEEVDVLQFFPANSPASETVVTAFLPESSLSRSRWLDATLQTSIVQEFVIEGETIAYAIYELDRRNSGGIPSAELVGFQKDRPLDKIPATRPPVPFATHFDYSTPAPFTCPHRTDQTSISCALTPRLPHPAMATSMLF